MVLGLRGHSRSWRFLGYGPWGHREGPSLAQESTQTPSSSAPLFSMGEAAEDGQPAPPPAAEISTTCATEAARRHWAASGGSHHHSSPGDPSAPPPNCCQLPGGGRAVSPTAAQCSATRAPPADRLCPWSCLRHCSAACWGQGRPLCLVGKQNMEDVSSGQGVWARRPPMV